MKDLLNKIDAFYEQNKKFLESLALFCFFVTEAGCLCYFYKNSIQQLIPTDSDQSVYINLIYEVYHYIEKGDWTSLFHSLTEITNTAFYLGALPFLFLLGKSRFALLIPNFIVFFLFQALGYYFITKRSKNVGLGFAFLGITLLTNTSFAWAGGISGFRADYMFAWLYAIWLILLTESNFGKNKRLYLLSAIVSGIMVFSRFYSALFLAVIILVYQIMHVKHVPEYKIKDMIVSIVQYAALCIVCGGWALLLNMQNFIMYYLTAMSSEMSSVWQTSLGFLDNLTFYPRYFVTLQMGFAAFLLAVIVYVIAIGVRAKDGIRANWFKRTQIATYLIAIVIPYLFLLMSNKQPVVISMWDGIFIYLAFMLAYDKDWSQCKTVIKRVVLYGGAIIGALGMLVFAIHCKRWYLGGYPSKDALVSSYKLNRAVAEYTDAMDMNHAYVMIDRWMDYLSLSSFEMASEEYCNRSTTYGYSTEMLNGNWITYDFSEQEFEKGLKDADIIVVAPNGYQRESIYDTDKAYDRYRDRIMEYCSTKLIEQETAVYETDEIRVYRKPQWSVETEWPTWMGRDNTTLTFEMPKCADTLIIRGEYWDWMGDDVVCHVITEDGRKLDATVTLKDDTYNLEVDVSGLKEGKNVVALTFDTYYVPNEINNESDDTRELSLLIPDEVVVE